MTRRGAFRIVVARVLKNECLFILHNIVDLASGISTMIIAKLFRNVIGGEHHTGVRLTPSTPHIP
jgi:hypothetical protein